MDKTTIGERNMDKVGDTESKAINKRKNSF